MSRRTSERNRAVKLAWENEQKLVSEGKGTRDWTPEQQQQILDEGRALDDDRRAFEGHHMKNVNDYPEYAGDPGNIQFLTRSEHFKAHKGAWTNLTNWYYDPLADEYKDFGLCVYIPCEAIELSEPIVKASTIQSIEEESTNDIEQDKEQNNYGQDLRINSKKYTNSKVKKDETPLHKKAVDGLRKAVGTVKEGWISFSIKHPNLSQGLKIGSMFALGLAAEKISNGKNTHQFPSVNKLNDVDNSSTSNDYDINHDGRNNTSKVYESSENPYSKETEDSINSSQGTPKSPHPRRGFERQLKNGIDSDGNQLYRFVPVRPTYVHEEQLKNSKESSEEDNSSSVD